MLYLIHSERKKKKNAPIFRLEPSTDHIDVHSWYNNVHEQKDQRSGLKSLSETETMICNSKESCDCT